VLYNCLSWYKFVNTHLYHPRQLYNIQFYTVSQKNDTDVAHYNFNAHQPILIFFVDSKALVLSTVNNIIFRLAIFV